MKALFRILILIFGVSLHLAANDLFFEQIKESNGPTTAISGITKDSIGYIWFGSWNGLFRYDGETFEVYRQGEGDHSLPANRIRNIITDDNKQLWVYTYDNQYVKFNYALNNFTVVQDSLVPYVVSVFLTGTPNLYNKMSIIDGYRYVITSHVFTAVNRELGIDKKYESNPFQPGGLVDDNIVSFYIDDQNIIWIGTSNSTIYKVNTNRKPFRLHHIYANPDEPYIPTPVRTILKDENKLWLGTNDNGVLFKDEHSDKFNSFSPSGLNETRYRSLLKQGRDTVWAGGSQGLGFYNLRTKQSIPIISKTQNYGLEITSTYAMKSSLDNQSILAGVFNRFARINKSSLTCEFVDLQSIIGEKSIMALVEDKQENIWLGTEGSGLVKLKFNEVGECIDTLVLQDDKGSSPIQLSGNLIYNLYIDQNNFLWVATTQGLNRINLKDNSVGYFNTSNGLPENYITAITEDREGNIWISHKKGISKIKNTTFEISNFNIKDTYNRWIFLDGACFNDTLNNILYFGADKGYVSFNPQQISTTTLKPEIILKDLYLSSNLVSPSDTVNGRVILKEILPRTKAITLDYTQRNFSIELACLQYYENSYENHFQYKLEGYDKEWMDASQRLLPFSRVPAGRYTLKVRAISSDNIVSDIKSLAITIKAPWYASTWAFVVYTLLVLAIIVLINREIIIRERLKNRVLLEQVDIEKREELNRFRIEFFTNVSHELKTPLTLITDPIKQLLKEGISEDKRKIYLTLIQKNVDYLSTLINQLLEFRKSETGKLKAKYNIEDAMAITKRCVETFHMNARQRLIHLRFSSDSKEIIGHFDKAKLEEIIYNLVSNAFKYTSNGGRITIDVRNNAEDHLLTLVVADNGLGIKSEELSKIFDPFNNVDVQPFQDKSSGMGLALTRNLINILDGDISIQSEYQKGTEVTVKLPYKAVTQQEFVDWNQSRELRSQAIVLENLVEIEDKDSKPILLIVEDNVDVQNYLKASLDDVYNVINEFNGEDGLESAINQIPDLIISDVMMPVMDGIEFCRLVKLNEKTCHIPVILLTAKTEIEDQVEGLNVGADYYIPKPFSLDVLKAQIKSILENRAILEESLSNKEFIKDLDQASSKIDNEYLKKVTKIVQDNFETTGFNNEMLSDILEISQRQLLRKIKALTGSTIQEFIVRVKMDEAARLLMLNEMTVSQISYTLGFSEPNNFTRTFTKHFGLSPTKWYKIKILKEEA